MVSPPPGRPGHSLPELIVALTFLAVTLSAIASGSVVALRATAEAVRRQEASALGLALLDSIIAGPEPVAGRRDAPGLVAEWAIGDAGPVRDVSLTLRLPDEDGGRPLVRLQGVWIAPPPALPPDDSMASDDGALP